MVRDVDLVVEPSWGRRIVICQSIIAEGNPFPATALIEACLDAELERTAHIAYHYPKGNPTLSSLSHSFAQRYWRQHKQSTDRTKIEISGHDNGAKALTRWLRVSVSWTTLLSLFCFPESAKTEERRRFANSNTNAKCKSTKKTMMYRLLDIVLRELARLMKTAWCRQWLEYLKW